MACSACRKNLGALGATSTPYSDTLLSCLRRALGLGPGVWDEAAHRTLYSRLAGMIDVQQERGMTSEQIRLIPWGSEPAKTAFYAGKYAVRYLTASDDYWTCAGTTADAARTQEREESGAHYAATVVLAAGVNAAEEGSYAGPKKDTGVPTVLIAAGIVALVASVLILAGGKR